MDGPPSPKKLSRHDFEFIERIGKGAYGRVVRARKVGGTQDFAIKIIEKALLTREGVTKQALAERNILTKLKDHPGIVKLFYTFQDESNLYFVLEYCGGGELLNIINRYADCFPAPLARFYSAQITNILEFMRLKNIAHRDLKPENILLNHTGQVKLIDFGTAKDYTEEIKESEEKTRERGQSFVGTADYVSPEMLAGMPITPSVDLWALGCIMFHLFQGFPPFRGKTEYQTFEKIRNLEINFEHEIPEDAKDLILALLRLDARERLGAGEPGSDNDFQALKRHRFFDVVDVGDVYDIPAPMVMEMTMQQPSQSESPGVILSATVEKKQERTGEWKRRQLIITSKPRIMYFDTSLSEIKGEISVAADLTIQSQENEFTFTTTQQQWIFREISNDSPQRWVDAVNKILANQ